MVQGVVRRPGWRLRFYDRAVLIGPVRDDVTLVELDGRFAAFISRNDDIAFFNETASAILRLCDGTRTVEGIAVCVASSYGVSADDINADVEQAVAAFTQAGLLAAP